MAKFVIGFLVLKSISSLLHPAPLARLTTVLTWEHPGCPRSSLLLNVRIRTCSYRSREDAENRLIPKSFRQWNANELGPFFGNILFSPGLVRHLYRAFKTSSPEV